MRIAFKYCIVLHRYIIYISLVLHMVRNLSLFVLIILFFCFDAPAQNMVSNGNFETYTSCPTSFSQTVNAPPWRAYHGGSSDYLHVCGNPNVSVPSNTFGWQNAASGNAYAGGYSFTSVSSVNGYTEYIAAPITALTIGAQYEVSMSVSLSNMSGYANNGLGVFFYDNGPTTTLTGSATLSVTPQVLYTSYGAITDTQNWVRVTGYFIADSAYDNIVIGRFNPPGGLTTTGLGSGNYSYYYVDSVVVKLATGINNLYADSMICAGDTFQVPYTINNVNNFNSGNVFSVQLSNASGSFASGTTTIGTRTATTAGSITCVVPNTVTPSNTYRIRIRSTNLLDSSGANAKDISIGVVRPNVSNSNNSPICTGQQLNLSATSTTTGVSYKWTGPAGFNSSAQNPSISSATTANSGDYIVTARLYGCLSKDTTTATVVSASASTINATGSSPICERDTLYLNATVGTVANSYSWSGPGFNSTSKDTLRANSLPAMSGDYIFTAFYTGCTLRDTVTIEVKPQATGRTIGSNSPVCTDNILSLNAGSSSTGVAYTWTGPNSFVATTSSASINGITLSNAGRYVVTYLLNGCVTKDSLLVTVNQSPLPVTASANTPLCEGTTLNLNSTNSTTGASYSWTGPGSYSSTSQNPTRANTVPSMSGDYIVTASLSNGCTKKDTVTVLVKPLPANLSAGSNSPVCEGSNLQLTGNTSSSGVSFSWSGPLSYGSTAQNPTLVSVPPAATGDYILTATLNGCTKKDTVYALVNANPAAPTAGSNSPVCIGQDINLTASTVSGATYTWVGPGGYSANTQNPTRTSATSTMAGTYTVRAIRNGCYSTPANTTVTTVVAPNVNLYPSPKDSICQGATVTFVATPSNVGTGPVYTWYRNNNAVLTGGTSFPTSAVSDLDEFYVTVTTNGVCSGTYTDTSNRITMRVLPWLAPGVSISANPNTTVTSGTMINFTATPTNGGNTPKYQWTRNGTNITGAISNVWGASTLSNNDQICVDMTSGYLCPNPKTAKSNCIKVSIESTGGTNITSIWTGKEPSIYPNPATEKLIIEGIDKGTKIQLNDVLGRVVVKATATNETTELNMSHLAAGSYMLTLSKDNGDRMSVKVVKE